MEVSLAIWLLGCSRFTDTLTSPSLLKEATSHMQHLCYMAMRRFGGTRCVWAIISRLHGKIFAEFCVSSSGPKIMDAGGQTS